MRLLDAHGRKDAKRHAMQPHLPVLEPEEVSPGLAAGIGYAQGQAGVALIEMIDAAALGLEPLGDAWSVMVLCFGINPSLGDSG